jgi:two-component system alkaline phosphatase synthesis response regulator PhoP
VSTEIPRAQDLTHVYRNSPLYDTLPSGRRAVRSIGMKRILIIEDDRDIVELVRYNRANEGFQVSAASDGNSGLSALKITPPDLLLLDLMLPKLSGLDICREIRRDDSLNRLPILMLTARGDEADRVVGLEMGADDYVTKPFSPRELLARVKALLRRAEPSTDSPRIIEIGKLAIDPASYRVSHSGKAVPLSTLEFRLLYYLASRPNRVFTRDQLLDAVWGTDRFVTPRSVDVYVRRLREKIEPDPENPMHLKTVRGAGYLFETRAA